MITTTYNRCVDNATNVTNATSTTWIVGSGDDAESPTACYVISYTVYPQKMKELEEDLLPVLTLRDFGPLKRQYNERCRLLIYLMFNVFKYQYYRKLLISKSGFLGRPGRRKKNGK